jgi:REP element-mobilizing transposase RayT
MPDHLHLIVEGMRDDADMKAFEKLAKQYSGFYYKRERRMQLWQRYGHDRIIRDDVEFLELLRYVVNNPMVAGLVKSAEDYPFTGSCRWLREELFAICRSGSAAAGSST